MSTFVSNLVAETRRDLARFQAQLTKMVREDADGHKLFIGPTTAVGGGPYDVWHCTAAKQDAYEIADEVCFGYRPIGPHPVCVDCLKPFWLHTHQEVADGDRVRREFIPRQARESAEEAWRDFRVQRTTGSRP